MSTATQSTSETPGEIPVLISGAGPTGLLTAVLLTKMNIPCQIVEREPCFSALSKAVWIHTRTQEILHLIDPELMDQILEQGEPLPNHRYYYNGKMLLETRMLPRNESVFETMIQLPQSKMVRILEKALEKASGGKVGVDWGWEVVGTKVVHAPGVHAPEEEEIHEKQGYDDKDNNGDLLSPAWVETTVRRSLKGTNHRTGESKVLGTIGLSDEDEGQGEEKQYEHKVIKSQYLVAADGARSVIRHKTKIPFEGRTRDYNFIVFDGTVDTDALIDGACINWFDGRGIAVLPMGEKNHVQIALNTFERLTTEQFKALQSETLTIEKVQPILDAYVRPFRMKILTAKWLTYYRVHERSAAEYIFQDRIILAGDAAHCHSFAAGQGMNLGLQDAHNLSWKLAMILNGVAPPSLVNSYNEERPAVVDGVIKLSAWALDSRFCLDSKFKRAMKRLAIAFHPIAKHLVVDKMAQMSMIHLRYHKNSLNKEHSVQKAFSRTGLGAIGQRAGDGFLTPFGNNAFGASDSNEFSSYRDLGSSKSNTVNGSMAPDTKDQSTIRFHDLMAGHPEAFQVLVFTADLWDHQASTATALSHTIEYYLAHWRSQWRSIVSSSPPPSNGQIGDETVKQPNRHHLFMVHTFTTLTGLTLALGKITLGNKMVGEGMAYTDVDGILHRRYEAANTRKARCKAAKSNPESQGAIIVVRPDSHIAFRVQGIGEGAWKDVDGYFQSILSSGRRSLEAPSVSPKV